MANNTFKGSTPNSPGDSEGKSKMKKGNNQIAIGAFDRGDYATALGIWRPLAEQGNAFAQCNLGVAYANGYGVTEDVSEAVKWFRLAAEQGDAEARINLRLMNALPLDRDTLKRSATFGSRTQRSRASHKTKH